MRYVISILFVVVFNSLFGQSAIDGIRLIELRVQVFNELGQAKNGYLISIKKENHDTLLHRLVLDFNQTIVLLEVSKKYTVYVKAPLADELDSIKIDLSKMDSNYYAVINKSLFISNDKFSTPYTKYGQPLIFTVENTSLSKMEEQLIVDYIEALKSLCDFLNYEYSAIRFKFEINCCSEENKKSIEEKELKIIKIMKRNGGDYLHLSGEVQGCGSKKKENDTCLPKIKLIGIINNNR